MRNWQRMLLAAGLTLGMFVGFWGAEVKPVQAADFNLSYNIDTKTSYSAPDAYNVAKVKMVKPNYVEEYYIQFCKDWFIVRGVECENIAHLEEMFDELYARQYYGPNPRVTSVRNALLEQGLFSAPLANSYKENKINDEIKAVEYIEQFIKISQQIGPKLARHGAVKCVDKITDADNVTYYYVNVMQPSNAGPGVLGKFQINQYGEIYYFDTDSQDYYNVDNQFVIE